MFTVTLTVLTSAAEGLADVNLGLDPAPGGRLNPIVTVLHLDVRAGDARSQSFVPAVEGLGAAVALLAGAAAAAVARKFSRRPF